MPSRQPLAGLLCLFALSAVSGAADPVVTSISVDPPAVKLTGAGTIHSLLVHGQTADGPLDLTHDARYHSDNPKVASVSAAGVVEALSDGTTQVQVSVAGKSLNVRVEVRDTAKPRRPHFENDVTPLLNRHGCNSSGCHGKAEGQNGFRLSVFGFDPLFDYNALVKEARGRRVF